MLKNNLPPRWAQALLRKFASQDTVEEVEGDLLELFQLWENKYGIMKARWKYILTVLTLLRPFFRRKSNTDSNPLHMIQSYFKMSWRTLLKNKVSSLINISGLTLGLTTSIIILLVVLDEFKYDQFHSKLPNIYVLMKNLNTNEGISTGSSTAGPMAEALRTEFPEVKYAARMTYFDEQQVIANDKISYENGIYADPDFFKFMSFPALKGDVVSSLQSSGAVVLSENMAKKLFGEEEAVGKTIVFNRHHSLIVGAVIKNIPEYSSIKFGMVLPFEILERENDWLKKWDDNRIRTWMELDPKVDIESFNRHASEVVSKRSNDKMVSQFAYPFKDLYLHGNFSNGHASGGRILTVQILIGFGAFMLLIACINFMNLATAQSEHRAKEVGIRKVLGATRRWIIFQFLNESFLMTFFSMIGAIGLTILLIPAFNRMAHAHISFEFTNASVWLLIVAIGLITSLMAGSYPSLFLSRFVPARVLKGRMTAIKGGGLRKALVTFQFSISIICLIATIIMYAQFEHVRNRPIGYEQANLINVRLDSTLSAKFDYIKEEALKIPHVTSATGGSGNILYSQGAVTGMDWPGKRPGEELSIVVGDVEYDWSKTIGIPMVQGRDFDRSFVSDGSGCLINESAVEQMGLKNPIGSVVGGHPVVGVFKNYVYNNPFGVISPMALYLSPDRMNHLYLRISNDSQWRLTINEVEKITKKVSPDFPFSFSFVNDEYQSHFRETADASTMVSIFGGMTIFISCLGLFGLSGFVAEKRSKEMSIRKVFGASISRVLISLSSDFLKPVLYALVLVVPVSVLVAEKILSNIIYRVPLNAWMFTSAAVMILGISFLIVFYHGWRTASENPVERLRNE